MNQKMNAMKVSLEKLKQYPFEKLYNDTIVFPLEMPSSGARTNRGVSLAR